jgi:uncharacterized protein YggU (UPF0235/DUF167 family)
VAGPARQTVLKFHVRLTPKGGRDAVEGWAESDHGKRYLKARVSVPPEDGKANQALLALLARSLGVAKSRLRIVVGHSSRWKTVEIDGEADLNRLGMQ